MDCAEIVFSGHAIRHMFERAIEEAAILEVVRTGRRIASYPDDTPYPSVLLLGFDGERPLHVVVGIVAEQQRCVVVTCYEPSPDLWDEHFTQRRTR